MTLVCITGERWSVSAPSQPGTAQLPRSGGARLSTTVMDRWEDDQLRLPHLPEQNCWPIIQRPDAVPYLSIHFKGLLQRQIKSL